VIYLKQSTASQSVLIGPFVDDVDGATAETGLTIANTDIRLSKAGGNLAAKNSGGGTHDEAGWYTITLDATDTNTVGSLQLHVKVTGALMVHHEYTVLEESVYDGLIASGADYPSPTAIANLELMYDGTGYTDATAPSSRAQVDSIGAASGGSLNFEPTSDNASTPIKTVASVGTETGTYTNAENEDGVYHVITHATNDIDWIYGYSVGGGRTAVEVTFKGYLTGLNDSMLIQVYDFVGTDWETVATLNGQAGTTNITITAPLLSKHTGTGADAGAVYVRFEANGAMTSPVLNTDQLVVAAVNIGQTVGYADGAIWVDTGASNTGTESFVDGTADNPVSTWAAALTLSGNLNIKRFRMQGGSSITLTGDSTGYQIIGDGDCSVALGGQAVADAYFQNIIISGTGTGSNFQAHTCHVQAGASIPAGDYYSTGFRGTSGSPVTESGTGQYTFHESFSQVSGSGTPYFDFSGAGGAVGINVRAWNGGSNWTLDSNCTISLEVAAGGGQTITTGGADCEIRGICRALTVAMSAAETVQFVGITGPVTLSGTTTATVNLYGVSASLSNTTSAATVTDSTVRGPDVSAILVDTGTTLPATLATASALATAQTDLDKLTGTDGATLATSQPNYAPATAAALAATDAVADQLNLGIIYGAAATGTLSTTQATSDLTGYADDQLIGRHITVTSGAAEGEQSAITDYASASGLLTFDLMTVAMANGDTFKIT